MNTTLSSPGRIFCNPASNSDHFQIELGLVPNDLIKMDGDMRGLQIVCKKGTLWITQANDIEDHFLRANEDFVVDRPGLVLIKSYYDGLVQLVSRATFWITLNRKTKKPYRQPRLRISNRPFLRFIDILTQRM